MLTPRTSFIRYLLLLVLLVVGCASARTSELSYDAMSQAPREAGEGGAFAAPSDAAGESDLPATADRLIVRTANLTLVVKDPATRAAEIAATAEALGGWVVQNNTALASSQPRTTRSTVVVRVPADRFDAALDAIKLDAVEVRAENIAGEDVTEQFVDLSARLANLEATRDRVRGFLEQARTVEDALDVNRELSRLEEEIERLKGRINFLQRSADFSSITATLLADADIQPIVIGGWRPQGTARNALQALINLLQFLVDAGIWLVILVLPVLLMLAGLRWVWRRLSARGLLPTLRRPSRRAEPKE